MILPYLPLNCLNNLFNTQKRQKTPQAQSHKQVLLNMGHHSQVICHYTERGRLFIDIDNRSKYLTPDKVKEAITKILEQYL